MRCLNCEIDTTNPKYCSRSCAAQANNSLYPKRHARVKCKCGKSIRSKMCRECRTDLWISKPIGEVKDKTLVRAQARRALQATNQPRICVKCGYDFFVEVSHKKAINSFTLDTPLLVINDINNLEYLCPNHHVEHERRITPNP